MTDVIVIFHFVLFFALFPLKAQETKYFFKIEKKHQKISSFYASVPKIMMICYTVSDIWCVTDVIFVFILV